VFEERKRGDRGKRSELGEREGRESISIFIVD